MARGGGTGSRTKQKSKKSDTLQNGTANGPQSADPEQKQMNKTTKHRKQKDETPPSNHIEEEVVKEEKVSNKLQPTSEQLRLAQLTQDSHLDPQRRAKITQVMDFTGKTDDEVATALFDCGWDEHRAIEMLLEEGGDLGSWEETGKKKKKKQDKEEKDGKENEDWDADNFDPSVRQDGDNRDKSRGRGPPRFKRGGGPAPGGGSRQDGDLWKNKEFQENERNFEGGRGRGGRGLGPRSRGGAPTRTRGRGGGPRQFGPGGAAGPGVAPGTVPAAPDAGAFGQIDTWNPVGEENSRRGKMSNRDAFDNAGNWGDDFPTAEDWDNDEYTGSLSDTKVFTPSGTTGKSAVGEPVNPAPGGAAPHTPANNSLSGASYGQQIDLSVLLQKPGVAAGGSSAAPGGPTGSALGTSLSQFNQTATQDLKTAIGIGGPASGPKVGELAPGYGSSALSYSSGSTSQFSSANGGSSNFGSAAPGSAFSPIKPAAVTNGTTGSKALPRARLPPPSKIPSSAVEMPGESLSNLDVQFGGLDLQFGANSESSATSGGFDFSGGRGSASLSSSSKDLDSKYSIPVTSSDKSLDNFKSGPASVKDVNQSLNNALSAAGIKPSGSSDSVGYPSNQRTDSKSNSNFAPQRSPGPQSLDRSKPPAVTEPLGGYNSSGYPYPSSSSQSKPSNQFGHPTNSYPSSNSYERQNSSGYSSTNGLSSSYGSGSGSNYNSGGSSQPSGNSNYSGSNAGLSGNSNYNSPYNVSTASSFNNSGSNSFSYKGSSNNSNSSYTTHSQFQGSETATTSSSAAKFDTSVTGSGYPTNNFGLTSSVSGKMSVTGSGSSKMLPNLPPGVASMIPQYMIGAGAGAGFPAYLAAGLQQPMYGYGGVGAGPQLGGVSGQQLEDLAALQRSTLANLPQLVGSSGQGSAAKGPSTGGYYDPSSQFGTASSLSTSRGDSSYSDNKFGQSGTGVTDSTSSPVPSTVATGQPTPFNALASTFAGAPTQHPTLPPGYAYFYGGMAPQLQAAYGQTGVYPAAHPGIVNTAAGGTATTQFQKQGYASSYNSYDSLSMGQNSSDYGKSNFGSQQGQGKGTNSSTAGHWYGGGTLW